MLTHLNLVPSTQSLPFGSAEWGLCIDAIRPKHHRVRHCKALRSNPVFEFGTVARIQDCFMPKAAFAMTEFWVYGKNLTKKTEK